jgi:hypothetical protein
MYRGNQDFLDLERNASQASAIPDDGIGPWPPQGTSSPELVSEPSR